MKFEDHKIDITRWSPDKLAQAISLAYAWGDTERAIELQHEIKRREYKDDRKRQRAAARQLAREKQTTLLPDDIRLWTDRQLGQGIKQAHIAGNPIRGLDFVRERHRRLGLIK